MYILRVGEEQYTFTQVRKLNLLWITLVLSDGVGTRKTQITHCAKTGMFCRHKWGCFRKKAVEHAV